MHTPIEDDSPFAPTRRHLRARLDALELTDAECVAAALDVSPATAERLLRCGPVSDASGSGGVAALLRAADAGALEGLVGESAARRFGAMVELYRRSTRAPLTTPIRCSRDVERLYSAQLAGLLTERFVVVALDAQCRVVADEVVARGGVRDCAVPMRDLVLFAARTGAAGVVLVHNHPSGDPSPSATDVAFTRRAVDALAAVAPVADHVIIGQGGCFSFLDAGLIVPASGATP